MTDINNIQDGPGESGGLAYQMEQPERGLELDMSALPPSGVSMGGDTATTILGSNPNSGGEQGGIDSMEGLDGLGSRFFNDTNDSRVFEGMDSMVGVVGLAGIHGETLENAEMYGSQVEPDFPFPLPETANPLVESDEH